MKNVIKFLKQEWRFTLKAVVGGAVACFAVIFGLGSLMMSCNNNIDQPNENIVEVTLTHKEQIQNNDDRNYYMSGTAKMWDGSNDHVNMFMNEVDTLALNQVVPLTLTESMKILTWSDSNYAGMDFAYPTEGLSIIIDFENVDWNE
tara:strand:- start:444 stop:881 length:438 start_codon:yes stop_codon:yes gene_type:complete